MNLRPGIALTITYWLAVALALTQAVLPWL